MKRAACTCALAGLAACAPRDSADEGSFRAVGIPTDFALEPRVEPRQILEAKGGGLAVFDANRDGHLDLFLPGAGRLEEPAGQGARLFFGDGALGFSDATAQTGLAWSGWGMGTALGDADADGADDVFIAAFGPDALLFGGEAGKLQQRSVGVEHAGWSSGATFCDLDGDGDLDLAVARYLRFDLAAPPPATEFFGVPVFGGPLGMQAEPNGLYENRGDGTFGDRTDAPGFADLEPRATLGVLACDLDLDGRQDLFFGNDSQPNRVHFGLGSWRFEEAGERCGLARSADGHGQATMGIAVADVNADGLPDLFTTNFARDTNTLHLSLGPRAWRDATKVYGLASAGQTEVGWGTAFADVDLDGDEDLLVANGHVYRDDLARELGSRREQPLHLWLRGGERFALASAAQEPWLGVEASWRGLVACDLDGDGDPDLVATALGEPPRVFENLAEGDAFAVELDGPGARLTWSRPAGVQTRWIQRGGSYQSSGPALAHFAGRSDEGTLTILWPDGHESSAELESGVRRTRVAR